ncbi:kinesin-II 95 kDa subunit-like isoform X7 [Lineus longissimus]|uniref:kinesin-II 95 kDa subunit-like isoform X7 n=1 Tax=Lineus longissimus TaxID=88925 RepID=UPI00315CD3B7
MMFARSPRFESAKSLQSLSSISSFHRSTTEASAVTENSDDGETDNINVVVRVRPLNKSEVARGDTQIAQFPGDGGIWYETGGGTKAFTFNVTFEPESTQEDVFQHSGVQKLIDLAINGYSCTAFAFGQTGSGKTHTITGPPQLDGVKPNAEMFGLIPRSFAYLYRHIRQQKEATFRIHASYLEIYNEQVIDLLNPHQRRHLQIRWSKNKGFYVENLFVVECESLDDMMAVLEEGLRNRISSPNDMNEFSSRSHTMLQLMIDNEIPDPDDENLYITKHGKLTFVDLAGSEKVKDSTIISGEFMAETNNINKSLLVLGNCISALADSKKRSGHIPYRDSKLTKLLADSIGGSGVTLMIACVSPSSQNTAETMNTLRYANRAKKIKNKPIVKMDPREKLILTLKRELKILRQENHYLRQQLNFPEKPRGKLQKENDEQFLKLMKQNARKSKDKDRDKDFKSEEDFDQIPLASAILPPAKTMPITDSTVQTPNTSDGPSDLGKPPPNPDGSGLYEMLQEYMVENETLRSENNDLQGFKDKTRRDQQNLSHENERLQRRLEEIERLLSSEAPNRFASIEPQYPYSDPNVTARGRQGSYGDLPPVDYRSAPNGYQGNSPPGSNSQSRQRQRSVTLPQHLPMKPPHRLNEPVTPRGNAGYPGQSYSEKFQQRLDQRDTQGGYGHNGSPTQIRGPPPAGPPSGYYGGHNDQNGPRYGSQSNSRRNSSGVYDDQDPVPTPRRKPGPTPDPIPRKSTTSQQVNPQGGTDEILDANSRLRNELDNINSEIQRNKGINELSRQIYDS